MKGGDRGGPSTPKMLGARAVLEDLEVTLATWRRGPNRLPVQRLGHQGS
jgi:hypothetical protein